MVELPNFIRRNVVNIADQIVDGRKNPGTTLTLRSLRKDPSLVTDNERKRYGITDLVYEVSMIGQEGTWNAMGSVLCFVTEDGIYSGPALPSTIRYLNAAGFQRDTSMVLAMEGGQDLVNPELNAEWDRLFNRFSRLEERHKNLCDRVDEHATEFIDITKSPLVLRVLPEHRYSIFFISDHGRPNDYAIFADMPETPSSANFLDQWDLADFKGKYGSSGPAIYYVDERGIFIAPNSETRRAWLEEKGFEFSGRLLIQFGSDWTLLDHKKIDEWKVLENAERHMQAYEKRVELEAARLACCR